MSAAKPAPWGEAHRREACARTHELVAAQVRERGVGEAADGGATCPTEGDLRWWLRAVAGFDAARIDREVGRVRDLCREPGDPMRKVRETVTLYVVPQSDHDIVSVERAAVEIAAKQADTPVRVVRVTRVRRASR